MGKLSELRNNSILLFLVYENLKNNLGSTRKGRFEGKTKDLENISEQNK